MELSDLLQLCSLLVGYALESAKNGTLPPKLALNVRFFTVLNPNLLMSFHQHPSSRAVWALLCGLGVTASLWSVASAQNSPKYVPIRLAAAPDAKADAKADAEGAKFFDTEVETVLKAQCERCHGDEKQKGGLRLDSREAILKGGDSGPAVNLDKPDDSLLLKAISYDHEDLQMPPSKKMAQSQIETLTKWVKMGLPWGEKKDETPAKHTMTVPIDAKAKAWWAFQPVKKVAVPKVKDKIWALNPIDNFILAKLEEKGLKPAPFVGKAALLRRASYDLTGLPPTPGDVQNFLNDTAPNAYEKVIDKLLASPQYGERWGRHWLDLVRYAETNSFERDGDKPFVWRYRDWVIKSLNDDKPYDQFLKEQLAGDEMQGASPETLIATGYYRLGQWDDEPSDVPQATFDELDDVVSVTAQTGLGMTVNCARCHDHKIDPISQKDYYKFLAFFRGVNRYGGSGRNVEDNSLRPISPKEEQERFAKESAEYKKNLDDLNKQLDDIEKTVRDGFEEVEKQDFRNKQNRAPILKKRVPEKLSQENYDKYVDLSAKRDDLEAHPPRGLEKALSVTEMDKIPPTNVLFRGSPQGPGEEVQPGFLEVLGAPDPQIPAPVKDAQTSGRRTALANWMTDPKNPLTARVMVNRIWQHHFGRGIVRSTSNFGYMGTPPTHPALLDYLATQFVQNGWKLKPLHKIIMMSNAYKMGAEYNKAAADKDADNDLFWRFDMRRLDAEEVRDSILEVNGTLNLQGGGPSIFVEIPPEVLAGQSVPGAGWGKSSPEEAARRSVYIKVKRSLAVPILAGFDAADTDQTCPVRFATTQPTQALTLMNSKFLNEQAQIFADSLKADAGADLKAQVTLGLQRVTQRTPSDKEVERGLNLMRNLREKQGLSEAAAQRAFALVLLNLNEFLYLD